MLNVQVEVIDGCVVDVTVRDENGKEVECNLEIFDHDVQEYDEQLNPV